MSNTIAASCANDIAALNHKLDSFDDPRECYRFLQERIREHHDAGLHVPDDLAQLERQLIVECMAESQGR